MRAPWLKRGVDIIGSSLLLFILLPLMLVLALLVWRKMGRPILFRQTRPGLHGKPFVIYKFRTMTDARDAQGNPLPDSERLTPFGKWLRATS
ncbi:MAG: sugar transferase, partial [Armatimonadota bacterium]|nr:sugar transferase [Armatimonadota bacterium]